MAMTLPPSWVAFWAAYWATLPLAETTTSLPSKESFFTVLRYSWVK